MRVEVVIYGCDFAAEKVREDVAEVLRGRTVVGRGCGRGEIFDDGKDLLHAVGTCIDVVRKG